MATANRARKQLRRTARVIDGRDYFLKYEREMNIEDMSADAIEKLDSSGLEEGPTFSRAGGNIATDLKSLDPEETERRREVSEEFLKRPARRVPVEDDL